MKKNRPSKEKLIKTLLKKRKLFNFYSKKCKQNDIIIDLSYSDLSYSDLSYSNLSGSDLSGSNLSYSDLSYSDLSGSNLSYSDLRGSDLSGSDLRGSDNIKKPNLKDFFRFTEKGMISFKAFGNTSYAIPKKWVLRKNECLSENVNPTITENCGCGINTGTKEWVLKNYPDANEYWEVLTPYEFLPFTVIPYHFTGKIRNSDVILLKKIK